MFSLACDWSKRVTWANIPQLKLVLKILKPMDNKHNSLNLALKIAQIFVLGHYLFLEAHSFPPASLSEKCSPLGTDNIRAYFHAK